jgi:hypothetical protein
VAHEQRKLVAILAADVVGYSRLSVALEGDEDGDRRTAVPASALAMTPVYLFGITRRDKADCAAETAAFEFVVHKSSL